MFATSCMARARSHRSSAACLGTVLLWALCGWLAAPAQARQSRWVHVTSGGGALPPLPAATEKPASVVADLDNDAVDDFVVSFPNVAPGLAWYRRTAKGWARYVIESDPLPLAADAAVHDIDGDGDLDLLWGQASPSSTLWWWENPYPKQHPSVNWKRHTIRLGSAQRHHELRFGDFLDRGRVQLAFGDRRAGALFLAEVPLHPEAERRGTLTTLISGQAHDDNGGPGAPFEGSCAFDVDGDGQQDLLAGNHWFKERGDVFRPIRIGAVSGRVVAGQFTNSKNAEVVIAPAGGSDSLVYYWCDGDPEKESCWKGSKLLKRHFAQNLWVAARDINGDGHVDILAAEMIPRGARPPSGQLGARAFVFYGNGRGRFRKEVVAHGAAWHAPQLGDFDGDGDIDILNKPFSENAPRVDLWLQSGTGPRRPKLPLNRWRRHLIDGDLNTQGVFILAGDLDNDGLQDMAVAGSWYRNPGPGGTGWRKEIFGEPLANVAAIYDFDGDGDLDVLGTRGVGAQSSARFVWARNDGRGAFTILANIAEGKGDFLQGVAVARFARQGPLEVALSWHRAGDGVQMLTVPPDPSSQIWAWRLIASESMQEDLSVADLDGDGDLDLFQGTGWLENPGTARSTAAAGLAAQPNCTQPNCAQPHWTSHVIGTVTQVGAEPDRNDVFDFTGDGQFDAVVGLENGTDLLLFESRGRSRNRWRRRVIGQTPGGGFSMDAADFDLDGDVDVVVGEHKSRIANRVLLFENPGRPGGRYVRHVIDSADTGLIDHHDGTLAVDIDNDGDFDIISVGWRNPKVWLYENRAIVH